MALDYRPTRLSTRYVLRLAVGGLASPPIAVRSRDVTLAAFGDANFGDGVLSVMQQRGALHPWRGVAPTLRRADIAFGNLECAISKRGAPVDEAVQLPRPPARPRRGRALRRPRRPQPRQQPRRRLRHGRRCWTPCARSATRAPCRSARARRSRPRASRRSSRGSGCGSRSSASRTSARRRSSPSPAARAPSSATFPAIAAGVRAARRRADVVVATFHWGVERATGENARQRAFAQAALGAGAAAVIGAHPHVLQPIRRLAGRRLIAYSLGNFVWSAGSAATARTGILRLGLSTRGVEAARLLPAVIEATRPRLLELTPAHAHRRLIERHLSIGLGERETRRNVVSKNFKTHPDRRRRPRRGGSRRRRRRAGGQRRRQGRPPGPQADRAGAAAVKIAGGGSAASVERDAEGSGSGRSRSPSPTGRRSRSISTRRSSVSPPRPTTPRAARPTTRRRRERGRRRRRRGRGARRRLRLRLAARSRYERGHESPLRSSSHPHLGSERLASMRVLIVEDEVKMASLIRRGLRDEGLSADVAIEGRGRALDGRVDGVRRDRPRRHAARHRRLRDVPPAARRRRLGAGPHAHRARRDRGPRRRPRRRRRRLPHQAVLVRRAARAAARDRAPRRRPAARRPDRRRPVARPRPPPGLARRRGDRAVLEGVRDPRELHAPARRGHVALSAARARLGLRVREPLERRRRLRALPAREDRPAVRRAARSRRCAARATGCARTTTGNGRS